MSLLSGGALIVNNPDLGEYVGQVCRALKEPKPWLFQSKYFLSLFMYSIFFHPRMHWFPKSLPWLRLGVTFFTLDFDINKTRSKVLTLGNIIFEKFQKISETRIYLTKLYEEKLAECKEAFECFPDCNSENIALLRLPIIFKKRDSRDRALDQFQKEGLGASGSYPAPLNELESAAAYFENSKTYSNAKNISERILTLPLHEYVTLKDIDYIFQIVNYPAHRAVHQNE